MALTREQLRCSEGLLQLALGRVEEAAATLEQATTRAAEMGLVDRDVARSQTWSRHSCASAGRRRREVLDAWRRASTPARFPGPHRSRPAAGVSSRTRTASSRSTSSASPARGRRRSLSRAHLSLLRRGAAPRRAQVEAREQLREAHRLFEEIEAAPWADLARRELRATGERLRRATPQLGEELTPQELQVALQVAAGKTNKEAGAALFLSPKTVEFHLARVPQARRLVPRRADPSLRGSEPAREPVSA